MNLLNKVNINKESQTANISLGISGVDLTSGSNRIVQFDWFMENACLFKKLADVMLMTSEKSMSETRIESRSVLSDKGEIAETAHRDIDETGEDWDSILSAMTANEDIYLEELRNNIKKTIQNHTENTSNSIIKYRYIEIQENVIWTGYSLIDLRELSTIDGMRTHIGEDLKRANMVDLWHTCWSNWKMYCRKLGYSTRWIGRILAHNLKEGGCQSKDWILLNDFGEKLWEEDNATALRVRAKGWCLDYWPSEDMYNFSMLLDFYTGNVLLKGYCDYTYYINDKTGEIIIAADNIDNNNRIGVTLYKCKNGEAIRFKDEEIERYGIKRRMDSFYKVEIPQYKEMGYELRETYELSTKL